MKVKTCLSNTRVLIHIFETEVVPHKFLMFLITLLISNRDLPLQNEMFRQRVHACKQLSSCHMSVMATEYMPMFKLLGNRAGSGYQELSQESEQNMDTENFDCDKMSIDDQAMETSDDDIEDW